MEFFQNYKRYFYAAGFILATIIMAFVLYAVFFQTESKIGEKSGEDSGQTTESGFPASGESSGQQTTGTSTDNSGLPSETGAGTPAGSQVARGGLTEAPALTDKTGVGTTLAKNGADIQMYDKASGKFYRISKTGEAEEMSDKVFYNVEKVTWSPNKNSAIIEYPDGANIAYNFETKKQVTLPSHWKDFDYSEDGKKIVMKSIGLDKENRWLAVSNEDGSNARTIEPLGEKDDTVYPSWSPNNQMIAMFTEGYDFDTQDLYFVGLNNENFKSTKIEGRGFEPQWSTDGKQLVYSVYSSDTDMKPTLWIVNAESDTMGTGRAKLNVDTWASKCTFSSKTEIYCGVPKDLEEGAGIFPEMANSTSDSLYKIDLQTGVKKLIAVPDGDYAMSNLIVSDNDYYLYFTDEKTQAIHKIKLK